MTRRFAQNDRNRHQLEVLHKLAVELPRTLSLVGVTDMLAERLVEATDRASECTISSWDRERDTLTNLSVYYDGSGIDEHWRGLDYPLSDWPQSRMLLTQGTAYCEYRRDDPGWPATVLASIVEWKWQTWIALPLVVEGRSVGLIEVADHDSDERWSPRDIAFSQTIANQAAMAVRNAQLYDHLRRRVVHDPLTGLCNHRALYERVEEELAAAQLRGGDLSVIALDLDDFRSVNDRDGHLAGDRLLKRVAEVLREECREADTAGRVGGDGFILVLPGLGDEAVAVAERVVGRIAQRTGTSVSAGVARMRQGELDAASLVDRADRALADAKRAGKDTFRLAA